MPDSKFFIFRKNLVSFFAIGSVFAFWTNCAIAQITPDATLPNNSRIKTQGNLMLIEGGTRSGSNLFHSFQQFSIPTGSTAYFNNPLDIQNIIIRVTGESVSNIDGVIQGNGTANLFLINPSGIIFGPNASLNIGGSFLGSTANSLNFADGIQFNAKTKHPIPLLSVSVPIGLGFGDNPGSIQVQGDGQGLRTTPELIDTTVGLRVQPNQTLALVGGDVNLQGATLKTAGGNIELGSVAGPGVVSLIPTNTGWTLDYDGIQNFQNIQLAQQASVDVSGKGGGNVQVQGRRVTLTDGSGIESSTLETQAGGMVVVNATESVEVIGISKDKQFVSGIFASAYPEASGAGSSLTIKTGKLIVRDGGQIAFGVGGTGPGGNLTILAQDSIELSGTLADDFYTTGLFTTVPQGASGPGGNLTIKTGQLIVQDGAQISSGTLGVGSAGNLTILAQDSVKVTGTSPIDKEMNTISSAIGTTSEKMAIGNGGNLILETPRLTVQNALLSTATRGKGIGGNLSIKADSIDLNGPSLSNLFPVSGLSSRSTGSGKAGNVTIQTKQLSVRDQAQITARNNDAENAGLIEINSNSINLDQGSITASTASKEGGNVLLNAQDLQLRHNSNITVTAGNSGNGGNITIDAATLVGLENSQISANAFEGRGGNITINTQGLFFSPDSQITATSERGLNGTVRINTVENDLLRDGLFITPVNPPDIAIACAGKSGASGSLVNTGRGGIPPSPENPLGSSSGWYGNSTFEQGDSAATDMKLKSPQKIVEAQGWKNNGDGTVSFTNVPDEVVPYSSSKNPCGTE